MEVDTNELLHRIGAVLRGISKKMDRLVEIGERSAREIQVHEMLEDSGDRQTDHFAGADKMVAEGPAKEQAEEPPKKWRILGVGEVVQEGDWVNAKSNLPSDPPNGLGWKPAISAGLTVLDLDGCVFARPVADEPAKEQEPEHPAGPKPDPGEGGCEPTEKGIGGDIEVIATARWIDGWRDRLPPADEPAKEPGHPAGPKPDPGEGYRILSKDPPEDLRDGDEFFHSTLGRWRESIYAVWRYKRQDHDCWYRRKIEVVKQPEPAWEPKVGDWVRVTRPQNWEECTDPDWLPIMHEYHNKVMQVSSYENRCGAWCAKCDGVGWFFHRDWLTPSIQYFAEPPEIDKPLETEYQRPSLPEDAGKLCEFSDDGESWVKGYLKGFDCDRHWNEGTGWLRAQNFSADRARHRHARIKKES